MTKLFCIIAFILYTASLTAQTFHPDRYGRVSDPKFLQLVKDKGYTIIGSFDTIPQTKQMAARMQKNGAWVYLDWNGKEYESYLALGKAFGFLYGRSYIDEDPGDGMMSPQMSVSNPATPEVFRKDNKSGLKLGSKIIVPAIYEDIDVVQQSQGAVFLVVRKQELYGLLDYQGRQLAPVEYDYLEDLNQGKFAFRAVKNGKEGILGRSGAVLVPVEYDKAYMICNENACYASVQKQGLYGAYNAEGKAVVLPEYETLSMLNYVSTPRLTFSASKEGKHGILSAAGAVTVPLQYEELQRRKNNPFIRFTQTVNGRKRHGVLDTNGKQILPAVYSEIGGLGQASLVLVKTPKGKLGAVDLNGHFILDTIYNDMRQLAQYQEDANPNLYFLSLGGKSGKIGMYDMQKQQFLLPCEYSVELIKNSYPVISQVKDGTTYYGLIDKTGKMILKLEYTSVVHLQDEQLVVLQKDGKYGVTDLALKVLIPFTYEYLSPLRYNASGAPKGLFIYRENNKNGIIDRKQQIIVPATYDRLAFTRSGMIGRTGDAGTVLDLSGKVLFSTPEPLVESSPGVFTGYDYSGRYEIDLYGNKRRYLAETKTNDREFYMDVVAPPAMPAIETTVVEGKENGPYTVVDIPAEFPGGQAAMMKFLRDNLAYPPTAIEAGLQGKCYVKFIVDAEGKISDIKISKKVPDCPECDAAAIAAVRKMPKWIPGKMKGKAVSSYYNLPVTFSLSK